MALSEAQAAELLKAAHDAPMNKVGMDHKGRRFLATHSMAWAKAGREWCEARRAALGEKDSE